MPRYDPKPFTITELFGRQAALQRGTTTLRRETQKFKKFNPTTENHATLPQDDGEWEESQSSKSRKAKVDQTTTNNTASGCTDILAINGDPAMVRGDIATDQQMAHTDTHQQTEHAANDEQTVHAATIQQRALTRPRDSQNQQHHERPATRSQGTKMSWNPTMNAKEVLIENNTQ